jgi:thiol-disulfide isomerase/thioredoxin
MKKMWFIPALALCAVIAQPLVAQDKPKKDDKPVEAPKEPQLYKLGATVDENLTLRDLDGKELKFKDLRGKVVLIHFWSSTCPFEIVADPKFTELAKRWKDKKDVVILAIDSNSTEIGAMPPTDKPGYTEIREHLKKKELTFPVYADHGNKVADLFQAQSTPHCFVLNPKGVIVYAGGLDDDPKGEKGEAAQNYARDAVENTLAGKEIKVKESKSYGCSIKRIKS